MPRLPKALLWNMTVMEMGSYLFMSSGHCVVSLPKKTFFSNKTPGAPAYDEFLVRPVTVSLVMLFCVPCILLLAAFFHLLCSLSSLMSCNRYPFML